MAVKHSKTRSNKMWRMGDIIGYAARASETFLDGVQARVVAFTGADMEMTPASASASAYADVEARAGHIPDMIVYEPGETVLITEERMVEQPAEQSMHLIEMSDIPDAAAGTESSAYDAASVSPGGAGQPSDNPRTEATFGAALGSKSESESGLHSWQDVAPEQAQAQIIGDVVPKQADRQQEAAKKKTKTKTKTKKDTKYERERTRANRYALPSGETAEAVRAKRELEVKVEIEAEERETARARQRARRMAITTGAVGAICAAAVVVGAVLKGAQRDVAYVVAGVACGVSMLLPYEDGESLVALYAFVVALAHGVRMLRFGDGSSDVAAWAMSICAAHLYMASARIRGQESRANPDGLIFRIVATSSAGLMVGLSASMMYIVGDAVVSTIAARAAIVLVAGYGMVFYVPRIGLAVSGGGSARQTGPTAVQAPRWMWRWTAYEPSGGTRSRSVGLGILSGLGIIIHAVATTATPLFASESASLGSSVQQSESCFPLGCFLRTGFRFPLGSLDSVLTLWTGFCFLRTGCAPNPNPNAPQTMSIAPWRQQQSDSAHASTAWSWLEPVGSTAMVLSIFVWCRIATFSRRACK